MSLAHKKLLTYTYILSEIIDSNLDIYLKKSLLYKTIDFSIFKELFNKPQEKKYQAPYLFETTNKKEELKSISNDGFNKDVKLIEFIGKNYKGNEKYFDTALKNELSFFKSALFGYKLELLGRRSGKTFKNAYGRDIQLVQDTFVKIPENLYNDKDSKFIFYSDSNYTLLEKNRTNFSDENNYVVLDLLNQNSINLFDLNKLNNKKASIIVLSPQVELKYEFIYEFRELVYLNATNFEQTSFSPEDTKNLEQFTNKKEK